MKHLLISLFMFLALTGNAWAAVLVLSSNGVYTTKTSLAAAATAADAVGKTVVVTSPQIVTTAIAWPTDRELRFEKGGYVTFSGAGALTGLKEARPEWFGVNTTPGTTDMTVAGQSAIDSLSSGGKFLLYPTSYLINNWELKTGVQVEGSGWNTTIIQKDGASYGMSTFYGTGGTTSVSGNRKNIAVRNLRMTVQTTGFSEHTHLLNINATSDMTVENVFFDDWHGDAVYIGSSNSSGIERHNERITVRNCKFVGLGTGRNGVSIIDGDTINIESNYFKNTSKSNMPGAIDIEPDAAIFAVVKDISITNNHIYTGLSNAILCVLPLATLTVQPSGIYITNNYIDGVNNVGVMLKRFTTAEAAASESDGSFNAIIRDNIVRNVDKPIIVEGFKQVLVEGNSFYDCTGNCYIGLTYASMDVTIKNNLFRRVGITSGIGLYVGFVTRLIIDGNTFNDCGTGGAGSNYAIDFNYGNSSYVSVINNIFVSPTGKTGVAIQKEAAHGFNAPTNQQYGNIWNSLANNFQYGLGPTGTVLNGGAAVVFTGGQGKGYLVSVWQTSAPSAYYAQSQVYTAAAGADCKVLFTTANWTISVSGLSISINNTTGFNRSYTALIIPAET